MLHVVAPLGPSHRHALLALLDEALVLHLLPDGQQPPWPPHITLVSFSGLPEQAATEALRPIAAGSRPLVARAHGYGLFTGSSPSELCLFVPVVRSTELDRLQRRFRGALEIAGATIAGQSRTEVWTPHVTLLDRCLAPSHLAEVVEHLARRPHPSWNLQLDRIIVGQTQLPLAGDAVQPRPAIDLGTAGPRL
jgi:2'-5' RNA ligase